MRYWWVNQNRTFRQEIDGGYLWSPKRNKNGHRNPFYEFMREVSPGDIVFSFCDTRIAALGIVNGYCQESPKPEEFGTAGTNWSQIGWRVSIRWQRLANAIRPKDHIARLGSELGSKYAPLTPDGNGLQSVYLTQVSASLASVLFGLIGKEAASVSDVGHEISKIEHDSPAPERDIEEWERRVEVAIAADMAIRETERVALVQARRGQGLFRDNVRSIERACRRTLKVEVNSAGRDRAFRGIIKRALGRHARYRSSTEGAIEDVVPPLPEGGMSASSLQFSPRDPQQEALMARPEVREHLNGVIRKHYEAWADQPIPALNGKTPRQALRTPTGRESVEALLAQFERDESRLDPNRDPSILASLRARLGLGA